MENKVSGMKSGPTKKIGAKIRKGNKGINFTYG